MSKLAKTLNSDLPSLAQMLSRKGRNGDSILAHITPKEAALLKAHGGSGTRNPETGLLEYFDLDSVGDWFQSTASDVGNFFTGGGGGSASAPAPVESAPVSVSAPVSAPESYNFWSGAGTSNAPAPSLTASFEPTPTPISSFQPTQSLGAVTPPGVSSASPDIATQTQDLTAQAPKTAQAPSGLSKYLTADNLLKLGIVGGAGGLGLMGMSQANKASQQGQQQVNQMNQIAAPYQSQGTAMASAASRGEMTPASQQAYQAMQAQLKQGVESRGGVGQMQTAQALESFRNQLLTNQYTYGLQVAQIGDNIALGAIKTGMQLDQNLASATQSFYGNLASVAAGVFGSGGTKGVI